MKKLLSVLLAVTLLAAAFGCLAEGEPEKEAVIVPDYYEEANEFEHAVTATVWEYPIVDGQRASGRPMGDTNYIEAHGFVDGACMYCDHVCPNPGDILTTASGLGVLKGTSAPSVLRLILATLPEDPELSFPGVDEEIAAKLVELLSGEDAPEEVLEQLASFPVETVDDVECCVVTLEYLDVKYARVSESYAFSTADDTLVKVF